MKKNTNIILITIIGIVVVGFIALSFLVNVEGNVENQNQQAESNNPSIENWYNDVTSNKTVVTIIASSTCPHCQEYNPVIEALAEEKGFILYFFESDKLSSSESSTLQSTYDLKNFEGYVPYTFVVSKNKFVNDMTGYSNKEDVVSFLKECKVY